MQRLYLSQLSKEGVFRAGGPWILRNPKEKRFLPLLPDFVAGSFPLEEEATPALGFGRCAEGGVPEVEVLGPRSSALLFQTPLAAGPPPLMKLQLRLPLLSQGIEVVWRERG